MPDDVPLLAYRDVTTPIKAGEDVLTQLLMAGADIQYLCMGGTCGTCQVRVLSGQEHLEPVVPGERHWFPDTTGEVRLACQAICRGTGPVRVEQQQGRMPGRP